MFTISCSESVNTSCICKILADIDKRQRIAELSNCNTLCHKPLLNNTTMFDTIPLLFVCNDCQYFIGQGVFRVPNTTVYRCIQTPVFRVTKVDKDSCHALVELLQPQTAQGTVPPLTDGLGICRFFPENLIERFIRTGICINLNLNCFCGVECLEAVYAPKEPPQVPITCTSPVLTLTASEIICSGTFNGTVICEEGPIANIPVTFSATPNIVNFTQNPVFTNNNGEYLVNVTIPPNTPVTDVMITATINVSGQPISVNVLTSVECEQ